jgi:hypothetical protein
MSKRNLSRRLVFLLIGLPTLSATALDLQPGEVRAPEMGSTHLQLTQQYSQRGDRYINGEKQTGDPKIVASMFQVRLGHAFELAGHTAYVYAQTPMGYVHPGGSLSSLTGDTGIGDTMLAFAFWPYANHQTETYFGLAGYLSVPTGSYSPERSLNMGENRYRSALQAGYQTPIAENLHWMGAVDAVWYGKNTEFGANHDTLEQDTLYTAQTSLRYNFTTKYALAAAYFYSQGGETSRNDRHRDDITRLHRYQISGIASLPFGRVTLQYGGDLETENGYIEKSRWILRYTRGF